MTKEIKDYYLGLDIGTNSVGWAVTDPEYNILEYRRKATWGIHLFEEGKTAKDRRLHRIARRRLNRRRQRITLLRELFSEEICKVDPNFFERLDESSLLVEDRSISQKNSLFNDPDFNDKDFHKKFPTIYHLRRYLMDTDEKPDIRLVYLACHNIIKFRGHFLFKTDTSDEDPDFSEMLTAFIDSLQNRDIELSVTDPDELCNLLSDRTISVTDKKKRISALLNCGDENPDKIAGLLAGSKVDLGTIFDESLKDNKISFKETSADDRMAELEGIIEPDDMRILRIAKQLYDWGVLSSILSGRRSISDVKIAEFEQHREDLKLLKSAVKQYAPEKYHDMFKAGDIEGNYSSYAYVFGKKRPKKSCSQEDFCKYTLGIFKGTDAENDERLADMMSRLKDSTFMPKQTSRNNSILPYTVHRKELIAILNNAAKHHPFLNETDESGFSVIEKVKMIQEFRIPYYVGPLDTRAVNGWAVRRSFDRVTPWNIEKVIDFDASAEGFMDRLTNYCTYMVGEKVLPKNSILYSYFMLYNEINKLKINGDLIPISLKKKLVDDLFRKKSEKVTKKKIIEYLKAEGVIDPTEKPEITGVDDQIKSTLKPMHTLRRIIGDKVDNHRLAEDIIRTITVFGERTRIRAKLRKDHSEELSKDEIESLSKLTFTGWGRLSARLLTGLYDTCKETGQRTNIIGMLESTNSNLMEILHNYSFKDQIKKHNDEMTSGQEVTYKSLDARYLSPAVKRSVWRTVAIVKDIVKCIGHPPKKVFVETTRDAEHKDAGKRKDSRKAQLMNLYKSCGENPYWINLLDSKEESDLKQRSLYLYLTQLGKCMYCGKDIDINDINNTELVDRDHIYPQSKIKDDSIHNNLVLTHKTCNQKKSDMYPLPEDMRISRKGLWDMLLSKGYITTEKHSRLIRSTPFTEDELNKFISRQMVETSQSATTTIDVLGQLLGADTEIVYVRAKVVSDFRNSMGLLKCRSVNDLHHAKDAFLNIVVGNVYDTKFTKDVTRFLKSGDHYNLAKMFEKTVSRDGVTAWVPDENGTKATVRKYMRRDNVLFTRYNYMQKGELFNDNLLKAKDTLYDRKTNRPSGKYGGFDNEKGACYSLIEYTEKKKTIRALQVLHLHKVHLLKDIQKLEEYYSDAKGTEVKVLIPVIKMDSLIEWNNFPLHIRARTGNRIVFMNALQLLLPDDLYTYCRKVFEITEHIKNKSLKTPAYYGVTKEQNVSLFDFFVGRCKTGPYSNMLDVLGSNLDECRDKYVELGEIDQIMLLNEILHSFQCNALATNLKKVNGVGLTGRIVLNSKLPSSGEIYLVNQSPSGLLENRVRLN